jgi:hypothetical protein
MNRPIRPQKTIWHPLSLQQLTTNEFIAVVNQILAGRYSLLRDTLKGASASTDPRRLPPSIEL